MVPVSILIITIVIINLIWIAIYLYKVKKDKALIDEALCSLEKMIYTDFDQRLNCDFEGDLAKLFHQINSLAGILRAQSDNKSKTNQFLKSTIEDISHQLKTPLAALNIYIGILQDDSLSVEERNRFVNLSEKELERMDLLVQNLLKLTKLDSGNIEFSINEESAEDMLLELCERFSVRAENEKKRIKLETEDISCLCDRTWTLEALGNLVKNSLDHMDENSQVTLRCKSSGEDCLIEVEDNGFGIHEEDLYYIFNRFYRSRFSKDKSGVGLGLSLTKAIIESQNGSISVDSILNKGSVFSVYLPLSYKKVGNN